MHLAHRKWVSEVCSSESGYEREVNATVCRTFEPGEDLRYYTNPLFPRVPELLQ